MTDKIEQVKKLEELINDAYTHQDGEWMPQLAEAIYTLYSQETPQVVCPKPPSNTKVNSKEG